MNKDLEDCIRLQREYNRRRVEAMEKQEQEKHIPCSKHSCAYGSCLECLDMTERDFTSQ